MKRGYSLTRVPALYADLVPSKFLHPSCATARCIMMLCYVTPVRVRQQTERTALSGGQCSGSGGDWRRFFVYTRVVLCVCEGFRQDTGCKAVSERVALASPRVPSSLHSYRLPRTARSPRLGSCFSGTAGSRQRRRRRAARRPGMWQWRRSAGS